MTVKKWQFKKSPIKRYPNRFLVEITADTSKDISLLLEKYDGVAGSIMISKDSDNEWNFSFYLYHGNEQEIKKIDDIFSGKEEKNITEIKKTVDIESAPLNNIAEKSKNSKNKIKTKRKINRSIEISIIYHKEFEIMEIKNKKTKEKEKKKTSQIVFEKIRQIVDAQKMNIDFKNVFEASYRNDDDLISLKKTLSEKSKVVIIVASQKRKDNILKIFKNLKFKLYLITFENITKKYKYLNMVVDIAITKGL